MLTALDHIIIGVNNLEQATKTFSERLGLIASGGGIHPAGGTANRIIVIGATYLELITVRTPAEAQQGMLDRLSKGEGYLNFVLASNDIEADSAALLRRGVPIIGPTPSQLKAPDGRTRGWSRTDLEHPELAHPELAQHYPFLIQHDSAGEERRYRLAGWAAPPAHPLGAIKVLSVTIAVEDLEEAAARFQRVYGLHPSASNSGEADGWEARLVSFSLGEDSGQYFELAAPLPFSTDLIGTELLPEPGALVRYLQRFGESLCRMTLAVESLDASRRYLDEHGVTYTYLENRRPVLWIHPHQSCEAAIMLLEPSLSS